MSCIIIAAVIAGLVTYGATPVVQRWAVAAGVMDPPGGRRVNEQPIPRAGGIAIFAGLTAAIVTAVTIRQFSRPGQHTWTIQVVGLLVAIAVIAAAGLVDDLKNLPAKWQALGIIAAGIVLYAFGIRIEGITNPLSTGFGEPYNPAVSWHALGAASSVAFTIVWVFLVTKTVDAIDGVDGLAAGVCAISAATLALMSAQIHTHDGPTLAIISSAVVGACLGFLRHNFHPARIIMGTVGAQVLGLTLAGVSIMGAFKLAAAVSVLIPVLVLGVPIFDFTHVLARRIIERAPLTVADRRHLHHRLLSRGWSQRQVVWFIYSVTIVLCGAALVLFKAGGH